MASERRPDVLRDETPAEVYDQFYSSVGDDAGVYGVYDRPYRDSHYFPLNKAIFEEVVRLGGQTILEVSCDNGSFAHLLFDKSELDYHNFDNSQPIYSSCEITASAFPPLGYRKGVRRCREPGDRTVAGWHGGANFRCRAADRARWRAAPIVPSARGYAG